MKRCALRPYRKGFVDACLAAAPRHAQDWLIELDEVAARVVAMNAPGVDRQSIYPAESVLALRSIGAFGVAASTASGGLGFGNAVAALAVETVAAACPSTAAILMFHTQVLHRLERFGNAAQRRDDLPRLASGEWLASSAWSELGAGADKAGMQTRLDGEPDRRVVNGEKHYCTGLEGAELVHVLLGAPTAEGALAPTFVRVRTREKGVDTRQIYDLMGLRGSSTGTVRLEDVAVEEEAIIGQIGSGMRLMQANHETLMNPGLLSLGIARAAYEEVKLAVTGGWEGMRATTDYQHTRFMLSELEVKLGAAYAYAAQTVNYMSAGMPELHVECSKVKMHASTTAAEVTSAAMQLAGSRAFTVGCPLERHFRDARATLLMGPTNELIKERIATHVMAERTSEVN